MSSAAELEALVASIAAGGSTGQVDLLVDALRQRFQERSRGSLFHTLKTELSAVLEVLEPPGIAHKVVASILGSAALGREPEDSRAAAGSGIGEDKGKTQPDESPGPMGAKARRRERLAKNRLERQRTPASVEAAATPLALILLESVPPLPTARNDDGSLTRVAEDVMSHGLPLLRAIFEGHLPWLRPRIVLRIVDVYGLAEGGAPIDRAAAAAAIKTQAGGFTGRSTRWRKPMEEGGKLLQWPSSGMFFQTFGVLPTLINSY